MFLPDLQPAFADPLRQIDTSLVDLVSNLGCGGEERGVGFGWVRFEKDRGHECLGNK